MATERAAIKTLKAGKFCIIDGEPCKVQDISISIPGKHGGAKARIEAIGVFDGRHRSIVKPADTEIEIPIVEKKNGQVIALSGNTAQVMDMDDYTTFESPVPEDLKDKLKQGSEVLYWILLDRKMIVQVKS